jgi:prepilin-type N-terminal cleavage/methylation domain-containing protein
MAPPGRARNAAFSLLEILAVVAIFALLAGLALPNFSALHARNLNHEARRLVGQIELARQRAIVTGIPHRLYIDIDGGAYHVERLGDGGAAGAAAPAEAVDLPALFAEAGDAPFDLTDLGGDFPIDMTAPRGEEPSYRPLAGAQGRSAYLDESSEFAGVETTGGWVDGGETFIRFERDGSADATTIVIEHETGLSITLEVLPLADTVRIQRETL